jgi:hypothetical protein
MENRGDGDRSCLNDCTQAEVVRIQDGMAMVAARWGSSGRAAFPRTCEHEADLLWCGVYFVQPCGSDLHLRIHKGSLAGGYIG